MLKNIFKITLVKSIFLMAITLPFIILWGELFTRILLPQNVDSQMNIFASDDLIGYKYMPNSSAYEKGREIQCIV